MREQINYIELPSKNLEKTKAFFNTVFEWDFIDYGPEYIAISGAGIDGGFYQSDLNCTTANGSALVVLLSENLEDTQARISRAGGSITREIFSFPGGKRFHFTDPNANEYAVWSKDR